MSDYIDDRIEGNFVFLAVRATDGSGRRAGVDLPMDPDELARFEGEQGLMVPVGLQDRRVLEDGIVGRMGFAPFRDDFPAGGRQPPVPRGGRRVAFGSARRRQGRGLGRMLGGG